MLTSAAIALTLFTVSGQAPEAGQLISRMLARYQAADRVAGEIILTVSALNDSGQIRTRFQFDAPSKLFIRQEKLFGDRAVSIVTSNGEAFTYEAPKHALQKEGTRLMERVNQRGRELSYRDIYGISVLSLQDRSAPLDVAMGRPEDMRFWANQLASLEYRGVKSVEGREVHAIGGRWREYGNVPPSGRYELLLTKQLDLVRYTIEISTSVADPVTRKITQSFVTTSRWDVNINLSPKLDPALFKLVR